MGGDFNGGTLYNPSKKNVVGIAHILGFDFRQI